VEITEVRIKLMEDNSGSNERLQAFAATTVERRTTFGADSATNAGAGSTRTERSATLTGEPSCTPTSPTRSTQCAVRKFKGLFFPPTQRNSNGRRCRATSRGTMNTRPTSSTFSTRANPPHPWRPATSPHCGADRSAATRSTHAATSRCSAAPTSLRVRRSHPRGWSPTTTTIAASRPRSAVVSEPPILGQSPLLLLPRGFPVRQPLSFPSTAID
jgi:hypothetical protein